MVYFRRFLQALKLNKWPVMTEAELREQKRKELLEKLK